MDNNFQKDMTLEDGIKTMNLCIKELRTRFIIKQPNFNCRVVTKEGIKDLKLE